MKAYTTEEINEQVDKYKNTFVFNKKRFVQWMIDNGHRQEDKPLNNLYKSGDGLALVFFTDEREGFGFCKGEWELLDSRSIELSDKWWTIANESDHKEWQSMLINEAKKRDYSKGNYSSLYDSKGIISDDYFVDGDGYVFHGESGYENNMVFEIETGRWAETFDVEVPKYTWEQLKEKLGHEFTIIDESKG